MHLTQGGLTVRVARKEDAARLCAWWNDGTVMAHAGFPNGLGTTTSAVEKQIAADADETGRRMIIEADGAPIGEMNYRNLNNGSAEIGIKICDAAQHGKGYGPICLRLLIAELFARGYEKIVLDTNLDNKRAQHVYEKLGFTKVRVRHDAWKDQLGRMQSAVDYELVPENFVVPAVTD